MATDFGRDLNWQDDCDAADREVTGLTLLGQAVYHRITTPRGAIIDDTDYGIDVRDMFSRATTPAQTAALPGLLRQEILKDERIDDAKVTLDTKMVGTWKITIICTTSDGPFRLVVSVGSVTIDLLESP